MQLSMEWNRPILLKDGSRQNLIYYVDPNKVLGVPGIYVFGRRYANGFEALYVGKAQNVQHRVRIQFNNLRLMQHIKNAKTGKRILVYGEIITKPGQRLEKCLLLVERALVRFFLSDGHDLVNKQGTRLRRHEVISKGKHPKKFIPNLIYLERTKG